MEQKQSLYICRHTPLQSSLARDALDAILAAAVYDQPLEILFSGEGVLQLAKNLSAPSVQQKDLRKNLMALPMFDITRVHVCTRSLAERNLSLEQLGVDGLEIEPSDAAACQQLIASAHTVLSF
ncbi:sulfurtransferase complex subunit TusC [Biformimicrobium ophioploci]|uniref:Sulfurtransferase complex subunit TusC n=1 Tax=Biformimicrobium ophioploci TaxID=3036711 RepID=A0ABQ6M1S7_9GAMM|nr:sulfurtransferase complex subunit TusC [Microbulbifer sp. NKW57]GMG88305.1 sulfurtransferase complex subunit TusC [Microbulbifer sp. NKW57]